MKTLIALALMLFAASLVVPVPAEALVCTRIGNTTICN